GSWCRWLCEPCGGRGGSATRAAWRVCDPGCASRSRRRGESIMVIAVRLPLAGYRVLELAHLIAGPVCGMYLADMGADVVKVEQPAVGDAARTIYDPRLAGDSVVFLTVNRNKRSVALDLGTGEGRRVFARLAARADVVVEAYRGGVAERLEIDYARLAPLNPRLVYCSLSAFGPEGPWREKPGLDMLVQAMGGLMAVTGEPDGTPILTGAPVVDTIDRKSVV